MMEEKLRSAMADEECKAWKALAGYKFWMFGYHSSKWVSYNKLGGFKEPNPWGRLVKLAKAV